MKYNVKENAEFVEKYAPLGGGDILDPVVAASGEPAPEQGGGEDL